METIKPTELLPCPFCLGEAEVVYIDNDEACLQGFYPRCSKCSINDDCLFSDKESAAKAWNTRADTQLKRKADCFEDLVKALEWARPYVARIRDVEIINEALAKAEQLTKEGK